MGAVVTADNPVRSVPRGEMVVGKTGGAGAYNYTVLGDSVNTAARLEAANKATAEVVTHIDRCLSCLASRGHRNIRLFR